MAEERSTVLTRFAGQEKQGIVMKGAAQSTPSGPCRAAVEGIKSRIMQGKSGVRIGSQGKG